MFGWFNPKPAPKDGLGDDVRAAAATFVKRTLRLGDPEEGMSLTMGGCRLNGEEYGDWEFTCRRIRKPDKAHGRGA